jgi:F-type H+/Na+-transporting ATPase subunit alpha
VLKQPQYATLPAAAQVVTLLAVTAGLLDRLPLDRMADAEALIRTTVNRELPDLWSAIERGDALSDEQRETLIATAGEQLAADMEASPDADE